MQPSINPDSTVLVIFGAGGDLAWRKLAPALYSLFVDRWLPDHFAIIGLDLKPLSDDEFRQHLRAGVDQFSRRGKSDAATWNTFAANLAFVSADFADPAAYSSWAERLGKQDL